jgi:hypothetical protein
MMLPTHDVTNTLLKTLVRSYFVQSLRIPSTLIVKSLKCFHKYNVNHLCKLRYYESYIKQSDVYVSEASITWAVHLEWSNTLK